MGAGFKVLDGDALMAFSVLYVTFDVLVVINNMIHIFFITIN